MKKLIAVGIIVVSACLVFFAGKGSVGDVDGPEKGEWVLVLMESNGRVASVDPKKAAVKLSFHAGKATWTVPQPDGGNQVEGACRYNPAAEPKEIEIRDPNHPERKALGIYKVEGDRLTLCIGPQRPKSFTSRGSSLLVFQRLSLPAG